MKLIFHINCNICYITIRCDEEHAEQYSGRAARPSDGPAPADVRGVRGADACVGIGAATAVFTLVHAALLTDLPFAEPDRLVWMYNLRTERDRAPLSIPDLNDYRRDASLFEGFAPFTNWTANLTGAGEAERLEGVRVSGNFFQLIGSNAMLGRPLQASDETDEKKVAVMTHGLWNRRFGNDPTIVGRTVLLNGTAYLVVGVMPAGFVFPFRDAEIAVPTALLNDPRRSDRGANFLRVIARLKQGSPSYRPRRILTRLRCDCSGTFRTTTRGRPG